MSLDYLPAMFDIILYDSCGTPFIGSNAEFSGMGGSEWMEIQLLENLAKHGKNVMSINRTAVAAYQNGAHYYPTDTLKFQKFKTKNLILQRTSQVPENIEYEKLFIWVHDVPSDAYAVHTKWANHPQATFVCVSNWQASLLPPIIQNKIVINNMVPDYVYSTKIAKNPNKFIYTSASIKGLPQTVEMWKEIKKNYFFKKTELLVLNPGYDKVDTENLVKNKIQFAGSLPFKDVVKETANSSVLFFVNTFLETFGISLLLAEITGTPPHILCLNGFGALKEILNSPFITDNPQEFQKNLVEFVKSGGKYTISPKDYRASTIIKKWLEII